MDHRFPHVLLKWRENGSRLRREHERTSQSFARPFRCPGSLHESCHVKNQRFGYRNAVQSTQQESLEQLTEVRHLLHQPCDPDGGFWKKDIGKKKKKKKKKKTKRNAIHLTTSCSTFEMRLKRFASELGQDRTMLRFSFLFFSGVEGSGVGQGA